VTRNRVFVPVRRVLFPVGHPAAACANGTGALGLVNAHTGKKATKAQGNQLAIDATNLTDALGC
jgi:hypothetical protein